MVLPGLADIDWPQSFRLIPAQYAPIPFFEKLSAPDEWDALLALESLTDPGVRQAVGDLNLVPREQRISGPGATWVMTSFTHPNPQGSRFSNGRYGVFYAAEFFEGALAEVFHHRSFFHRHALDKANNFVMRCLTCAVRGRLYELRRGRVDPKVIEVWPHVYDHDDYRHGQDLGGKLHANGGQGIVYTSVRLPSVSCVAIFQPSLVTPPDNPEQFILYHWDGEAIVRYMDCQEVAWQSLPV